MQRFFRILVVVLLFAFLFRVLPIQAQVLSNEYISSFDSTISVEKNTDLQIEERIVYHTDTPKHGIYRYIPYRYTRNSVSHTAQIEAIEITDESGDSYQYETTREDGILNIRIGDPDRTFTGDKTYHLRYRVKQGLQQYDTADELYWDITGEGWQFPVLSASTRVVSAHAPIGQLRCFTGGYGTTEMNCQAESTETGAVFQTSSSVLPNENFTIVVELKRPNELQFPTEEEKALAGILANWWIPVLCLPLLIMGSLWLKRGRDWMFLSPNVFADEADAPQQVRPLLHRFRTPMVYEPIQNLTPAEVGAIENERIEAREIVAEIVDLARQKLLKIEATEKKGLLGIGSSTQYSLKELTRPRKLVLAAHQEYLLKELFADGKVVKTADLKGKFATQWAKFQEMVWKSITEKGYFTEKPQTVQGLFLALGIALLALAFFLAVWLMENWVDSPVPILLVIVQGIPVILFALARPRKSARGVNILLQARGLKATIQRGAWREKIKEKHLFIEEVLPFAVAFGVVDQLASQMKQLGEEPPQYMGNAALNAASFQHFSQNFTSQVGSDLTYNPSSSHSSGGSGFSSGGGFSGGGGGGGGGGSW